MLCNVIIQTKHIESYDFKKVFGVITKDLKYMCRKLAGDLCSNNGCNINRSIYFFRCTTYVVSKVTKSAAKLFSLLWGKPTNSSITVYPVVVADKRSIIVEDDLMTLMVSIISEEIIE